MARKFRYRTEIAKRWAISDERARTAEIEPTKCAAYTTNRPECPRGPAKSHVTARAQLCAIGNAKWTRSAGFYDLQYFALSAWPPIICKYSQPASDHNMQITVGRVVRPGQPWPQVEAKQGPKCQMPRTGRTQFGLRPAIIATTVRFVIRYNVGAAGQ